MGGSFSRCLERCIEVCRASPRASDAYDSLSDATESGAPAEPQREEGIQLQATESLVDVHDMHHQLSDMCVAGIDGVKSFVTTSIHEVRVDGTATAMTKLTVTGLKA